MTQRKINARDIIVQIEAATADNWLDIENMASATINPGEQEEVANTTDFDSEGNYEEEKMQRGATMSISGQELKDDQTGALQPGRARVEFLANQVSHASIGRIRFRHPSEPDWTIWPVTASLGEKGGDTNAKSAWACTFTRSGAASTEPVA